MTEKSEEPIFIAQIEQDPSLHNEWFKACTQEAQQKGCTFGRYSVYEDDDRFALVEAWVEQPSSQGAHRWSFR